MNTNYASFIPNWNALSAREKFRALIDFRKRQAKKEAAKERANTRKRDWRTDHPKPPKSMPFVPPEGYYGGQELARRLKVDHSTIKRYVRSGYLKEYRIGRRVAFCEADAISAIEGGKLIKQENGKFTSVRQSLKKKEK